MDPNFILYANKSKLEIRKKISIASGALNAYTVQFIFSEDWDNLKKTAAFRSGSYEISTPISEDGFCTIPWEVLSNKFKGRILWGGCLGTQGDALILPTVWASLGMIHEGVSAENSSKPPETGDGEDPKDHRFLINRDAKFQHPISSITGLDEKLKTIPPPIRRITNSELEELLK